MHYRPETNATAMAASFALPQPWNLAEFVSWIARARQRPIQLLPAATGGDGWWIGTDRADYIVFEQHTSGPHREHTILHELAHMLFGHPSRNLDGPVSDRPRYSDHQEREAELFASRIMQRAGGRDRPEQLSEGGPLFPCLHRRIAAARHAADLRPLWRTIVDGDPDVTLCTDARAGSPRGWYRDFWRVLTGPDPDFEVVRRVIEIRDGYLALRPWLSFTTEELAHHTARLAGEHGYARRATVEAALIVGAIADRAQRRPGIADSTPDPGAPDMASEITWLTQVSDAIESPLIPEILDRRAARNVAVGPEPDVADATVDLHWAAARAASNRGRWNGPGERTTSNISARLNRARIHGR